MLKIKELEYGRTKNEEVFEKVSQARNYLEENDFFSWITDEEPEKAIPDFSEVTDTIDLESIFREFNYSYWTMQIEEVPEPKFKVECNDYDIEVYRFEDDTHYMLIKYHENVILKNRILFITEKEFDRLQNIFNGFDDMEMDEQSSTVRFFEDEFHI